MKQKLKALKISLVVATLLSGCGNSDEGKFVLDCTIFVPSLLIKSVYQSITFQFDEKAKTVTGISSFEVAADKSESRVISGYPEDPKPAVFTDQFIKWENKVVDRSRGTFSSGEYSGTCKKVEKKF